MGCCFQEVPVGEERGESTEEKKQNNQRVLGDSVEKAVGALKGTKGILNSLRRKPEQKHTTRPREG